jgi:hypothetical protein
LQHFDEEADTDPNLSENLDLDSESVSNEKPDPDPHHSDADPQYYPKLYPFETALTNNSIQRSHTSFSLLPLQKRKSKDIPLGCEMNLCKTGGEVRHSQN